MQRYTTRLESDLPLLAVDLGYSARSKSCGVAWAGGAVVQSLEFGECIERVAQQLSRVGRHTLILEAVLSSYHTSQGNPTIRGEFEKGRGWYHGPGVTTFAAALRFVRELNRALPSDLRPIPLVEGFLSYKPVRTAHSEDALRLLVEFDQAECFEALSGSEPICDLLDGVPQIRRYNRPA
ncbi:MAG: hypothetical protein ABS34_07475 [Opitutaceae bacterium BACL24 MAG-120322-bin51]|nr:MAG: hypothetical protein ABS34_07475 [Opitutaceae bacterium BACL24 MAG-120322-bin51]